jgi:hypothetical protein
MDFDFDALAAKEQEERVGGFGGEGVVSEKKAGKKERKSKGKKTGKGRNSHSQSQSQAVEEQEQEQEVESREELGDNNEEMLEETVTDGHDEETSQRGGAETLNSGLDGNFDDNGEYVAKPAPKSKRSRKSNGTTKKRKRDTVEAESAIEPSQPVLEEQQAESAKNKARSTRSRKSRKAFVEEDTQEPEATRDVFLEGREASIQEPEVTQADGGDDTIPADLAELPKKLKKAKKKARISPHRAFEDIVPAPAEDDNDSAAVLHLPLTPAHTSHHRNESNAQEDNLEAAAPLRKDVHSSASVDPEEKANSTPKQPSKKALGKRMASGIKAGASKKRKTQKDKAAGTPELASFGFTMFSEGNSSVILPESKRRPTPAFTPINRPSATILPPSAQKPSAEPGFDEDSDEPEYVPESNSSKPNSGPPESSEPKSSKPKKKRRLPVGDDKPSKSTPKTPQKRSAKSKTPKSEAKTPQPQTGTARGGLSTEEIEAITAAVEEYRDQNNLTQFEINELIQKDAKKDGLSLWNYIRDEVPDIPRSKVLNVCRRRFHNFEARGTWTEEADEELREAYEKYPGKWKQIGAAMNRFSEDCRDRWRNYLVCGENMRKDFWDKEEEERLKDVVQECIESIREGRRTSNDPRDASKSDESLIDWSNVSQRMGRTRSRLQCLNKWKKLKDREEVIVNDPVIAQPIGVTWRIEEAEKDARKMKAKEKLQLLYAIRESGAGREGKIPWRRVQEELTGKPRKMALRVCFRQMRQNIEDNEDMKLQDIVDALVDAYEAAAPTEPRGFGDFAGFRASQRKLSRKQKRKKSSDEVESSDESSDDNGEGPSTISKKTRRTRLSEKYVVENEDEDDDYAIPRDEQPTKSNRRETAFNLQAEDNNVDSSGTKKTRKLRERMKDVGQTQSQSQETDRRPSELSDIHTALESMRTGISKARLAAARDAAKALKDEHAFESDEEDQSLNGDLEAADDIMDLDKLETYTVPGGPEAEDDDSSSEDSTSESESSSNEAASSNEEAAEDTMDLDKRDVYVESDGPEAENDDFPFGDEEDSLPHYDQESVDLDQDRTTITNGNYDDKDGLDGQESDIQDSGSVDLDAPVQTNYERRGGQGKRLASPISFKEDMSKLNGYANGHNEAEERVSSDDSDMADIPAKIPPRVVEMKKKKKTKSAKRALALR